MTYAIIVADPPWDYKGQSQHAGSAKDTTGGAATHYPTMTTAEMITAFRPLLDSWAEPDCLLFMWATWPHLDQAIQLGEGWGFRYVHTPFIWNKVRKNPGYYTMTQTEPVLCFKRGKIPRPRGTRNEAQLITAVRGAHSVKPQEVYDAITRMFPTQAKMEMFARRSRPDYDNWGNEVDKEIT